MRISFFISLLFLFSTTVQANVDPLKELIVSPSIAKKKFRERSC